jgi:hypothetical protein
MPRKYSNPCTNSCRADLYIHTPIHMLVRTDIQSLCSGYIVQAAAMGTP